MARTFKARKFGLTQADDVQRQINYLPSNVTIYRSNTAGDGVHAPKGALSFVASFEGLIAIHERIGKSMIDIREPYGQVNKTVYILITRAGVDRNGNTVKFQQGDFAWDGTNSYLVDSSTNFSFKYEGVLELLQ